MELNKADIELLINAVYALPDGEKYEVVGILEQELERLELAEGMDFGVCDGCTL